MASSNLSLVLKKKKGITLQTALSVAKKLNFSESERALFCTLVEKEHARSRVTRLKAEQEITINRLLHTNLSFDLMKVVGGWFHFALMELLRTPSLKDHTSKTLAEALEVRESEVDDAIKILLKTGLIEKKKKTYSVVNEYNWSPDGIPSEIIRRAHEKHLNKSKDALFTQAVEERDFTSMILSIDHSDLSAAKKDVRDFIKAFTNKYSDKATADRVYSMNIQLFNLTTGLNRGSHEEQK